MDGIAGIIYCNADQTQNLIDPMLMIMQTENHTKDSYTYKNMQVGCVGDSITFSNKKGIYTALNGSIHNTIELVQFLKKNGVAIHANCNHAELISHAYSHWGRDFIAHLDGSFAIVILDHRENRLLLYRDRIGKKSLYWYKDARHFLFSSEIKALLVTGVIPQTIAKEAMAAYLYFGYIPQDMTPIKNVNKLLPGHYLQWDQREKISIHSYWSYSSCFEKKGSESTEYSSRETNDLLLQSVKNGLRSQPVGCFLTGGLGSAGMAHYLRKILPEDPIYAFTVGFQGKNQEEKRAAQQIAKILNLDHTQCEITPQKALDPLVEIAWNLEEPIADPYVLASWQLGELAKSVTPAVFSDVGYNELFADHSRYDIRVTPMKILERIKSLLSPTVHHLLIPFFKLLYKPAAFNLAKRWRTNPMQYHYIKDIAVFDEKTLRSASPELAPFFDPVVFLNKFFNLQRVPSIVSSFLYLDVKTRLADSSLLQYERSAAAQGLQLQTPFLGQNLVEYLANLSENETASAFKQILFPIFPETYLENPRPAQENLGRWMESSEFPEILTKLPKGYLVEAGLIKDKWLKDHIDSSEKRIRFFPQLWSLLFLEIWFRLYINKPIKTKLTEMNLRELIHQK